MDVLGTAQKWSSFNQYHVGVVQRAIIFKLILRTYCSLPTAYYQLRTALGLLHHHPLHLVVATFCWEVHQLNLYRI
jgi:hypothetical protein